jgi:hypothetical protein
MRRPFALMLEIDIYHDESKEGGYWHGLLFVPRHAREDLLALLERVRERSGWVNPVEIKKSRGNGRKLRAIRAWTSIGISALAKREPPAVYDGSQAGTRMAGFGYLQFPRAIGARFSVFHSPESLTDLNGTQKANVETTLRTAVKGLIKYGVACGVEEPLKVKRVFMDGWRHYGSRIDAHRLLSRLSSGTEPFADFSETEYFDFSSDHRKEALERYGDCQFLQLTDCLVGGVRILATDPDHHLVTEKVLEPLRGLLKSFGKGVRRMTNSRYGGHFAASSYRLVNDSFTFEPVRVASPAPLSQMRLFNPKSDILEQPMQDIRTAFHS